MYIMYITHAQNICIVYQCRHIFYMYKQSLKFVSETAHSNRVVAQYTPTSDVVPAVH